MGKPQNQSIVIIIINLLSKSSWPSPWFCLNLLLLLRSCLFFLKLLPLPLLQEICHSYVNYLQIQNKPPKLVVPTPHPKMTTFVALLYEGNTFANLLTEKNQINLKNKFYPNSQNRQCNESSKEEN